MNSKKVGLFVLAVAASTFALGTASAQIVAIAPGTLTGTGLITFDDVLGGGAPGTNYNAIFESNGADFAERFVGQILTPAGDADTLSGSPTGPLTLLIGAANQNLNVFINGSSQVLTGLGNAAFPNFNAIGEGSFAVLFDFDQSQFGFDLVGGNLGNATVDFFRRNGSLIQSITLTGLTDQSYAFARVGGIQDIAGISIWNTDGGGIGFDNLRHDVPGVIGPPPTGAVPEPSTYGALGALFVFALIGRRQLQRRSAVL